MKPRPINELLAVPLRAAIQAKIMSATETLGMIKKFGIDSEDQVKNLTFKTTKMVELPQPAESKKPVEYEKRNMEVSIPLLTLINLPSVQLTEMNVEMAIHVVDSSSQTSGMKKAVIEGAALPLAGVLTNSQSRNLPPTMKINMKIVERVPEGLARVNDLLADMLQGRSIK
ncbi:MAG: DUF2589 domain-containing protein [Gallionellaceae bacterium]